MSTQGDYTSLRDLIVDIKIKKFQRNFQNKIDLFEKNFYYRKLLKKSTFFYKKDFLN